MLLLFILIMIPDNEVNVALSRMKSGKHPLETLIRLTNNISSSLKHSVCTIVFFASCFYVSNLFKEENNPFPTIYICRVSIDL